MKKIRLFISSLCSGGAERVLTDVSAFIKKQGYDVTVLSVIGGENVKNLPSGITYKCIFKRAKSLRDLPVKLALKMPRGLFAALFLKGSYDVDIAYLEGRPTRFLAAKKGSKRKVAFVHMDVSVANVISAMYKSKEECLEEYRGFDDVCFVSEDAMNGFERCYGSLDNARVVHNIIDREAISRKSLQSVPLSYTTDGLKLVTAGRLEWEKNFSMLLDVFGRLSAEYPMELWILGDGSEREKLNGIISQNKLTNVKMLGFCENPYPYIKQADMFVCSSLFEGYSTAVSEALLLGVPVITTDCAGMSELLAGGKYGMITENSAEGLFQGLKTVLENKDGTLSLYRERLASDSAALSEAEKEYAALLEK